MQFIRNTIALMKRTKAADNIKTPHHAIRSKKPPCRQMQITERINEKLVNVPSEYVRWKVGGKGEKRSKQKDTSLRFY
jgi:hypothetical protein